MQISVHFYSYFKELTGCAEATEVLQSGQKIDDLLTLLIARFPKLAGMQNSTLIAVGVDYQGRGYVLLEGDEAWPASPSRWTT